MSRRYLPCFLTLLVACGSEPPGPPTPSQVSVEDFRSLHWLEGRWRGSEGAGDPFFEEYRFLNDSTIRSLSFADSTLIEIEDSSTIVLSGGNVFSRGENSSWVVTKLDGTSVTFEPQLNAVNAFTWSSTSDSSWTATLFWHDAEGEAKQRVYQMQRLSP